MSERTGPESPARLWRNPHASVLVFWSRRFSNRFLQQAFTFVTSNICSFSFLFFFSLFFKLRWIPKDILGFTRLPRIPQVLARTTGVSRIQRTRRETAPYELQGCGFSVEPDSYWLVCSGGFRGIPGQRQVSFKFPCILYRTLLQLRSAGEPAACLSDEGEWDAFNWSAIDLLKRVVPFDMNLKKVTWSRCIDSIVVTW